MSERMKYPRIPHAIGSSVHDDDEVVSFHKGNWIATEKVDGSQISLTEENGVIRAFNRNTELLLGHSDKQFDMLAKWLEPRYHALAGFMRIGRYSIYGE